MAVVSAGIFLAQLQPDEAGRLTGTCIPFIIALFGIHKCWAIARRPATNSKSAMGLMLLLIGWVLSMFAGLAVKHAPPGSRLSLWLAGGLIVPAMILTLLAVFLAVQGLMELRADRRAPARKYNQGSRQAVWTLILAAVLLGLFGFGVVKGVGHSSEVPLSLRLPANSVNGSDISSSGALRLDAFNFKFDPPEKPWVRIDSTKLVADSVLGFMRTSPTMSYVVIAEAPGRERDISAGALAEFVIARLGSSADSFTIVEKTPQSVNGLDGIWICTRATVRTVPLFYIHWICVHQGYWYQLVAWGRQENESVIRAEAISLNHRFGLIDAARIAHTGGAVALAPFHSDRFHYGVQLKDPGWRRWVSVAKDMPDAQFGAMHDGSTCFFVIPVSLMGEDADMDNVTDSLLSRMNIAFDKVTDSRKIEVGPFSGYAFRYAREINGTHYDYQFRSLKGRGYAYLVGGWTGDPAKQSALVGQAIESFSAGGLEVPATRPLQPFSLAPDPQNALPDPSTLSDQERATHSNVLNHLGLRYLRQGRSSVAASWFGKALLAKADPTIVENLAVALTSAGEPREALSALDRWMDHFPHQPKLKVRAAKLEEQTGNTAAAMSLYEKLFSDDAYEDTDALTAYARLLAKTGQLAKAQSAVESYVSRRTVVPSELIVLQADLYTRGHECDRAIALLHSREKTSASLDVEIAYGLADAYIAAERYGDALRTARSLADSGDTSADACIVRGKAELGLKHYRDARTWFEAAAVKAPESVVVQRYLRRVAAMLGQGDSAMLQAAIEPVAIPQGLLEAHPSDSAFPHVSDSRAIYLDRTTAIEFERGKQQKTTEYRRVKVLDARGVDEFSTFQFSFDPLAEQAYVNKLQVFDAEGKVVWTGNVHDYYAVDSAPDRAGDGKVLNIPVSGLKPGYSVELMVTLRDTSSTTRPRLVEHLFSATFPCARSVLFFHGDTSALKHWESNGLSAVPLDGGLCWTVNCPPPFAWEPLQASASRYLPVSILADGAATWEAEGKAYLATIADQLQPDSQAVALAGKLTQGMTTDEQKIASLLAHVRAEYTYKAIEFGRRARIPNKATEVIRNRYGDCKDHALLLQQLLAAAGVHSCLALVRTGGCVEESLPSLDQFDHMIVYLPGTGQFLDGTDKDGDSGGVPLGLGGTPALVLDPAQAPRLVHIPAYGPDSSTLRCTRDIRIEDSGDAVVHETIECTGHFGAMVRNLWKRTDTHDRFTTLQDMIDGRDGEISVRSAVARNVDLPERPLLVEMEYVVARRFLRSPGRLTGSLPAAWERHFLRVRSLATRQTPFIVRYPLVINSTVTLAIPSGFELDRVPTSESFQSPFATGRMTFSTAPGRLLANFEYRAGAGDFAASAYAAFQRQRESAAYAAQPSLMLTGH